MSASPMEQFLEKYPPPDSGLEDNDGNDRVRYDVAPRKLPIDARIDLHGSTVEQALAQLDVFIKEALAAGHRKVLVVHGKGQHDESEGTLRRVVRDYFERNDNVGAIGVPKVQDGGTGATWAVVRHRSR